MFNNKDKDTDKALIYLPKLAVGIPVTRNVSAVLSHLIRHNVGDFQVSLQDLRKDGATVVISSHIKIFPEWLDENYGDMEPDDIEDTEEESQAGYHKWPDLKAQAVRQEREKNGIAKYDDEEDDWEDDSEDDMAF